MNYGFPIAAFYKNIIFNNRGKAFGVYRLEPSVYRFYSNSRKITAVSSFEEMLSGFSGTGQILLLWEDIGMDEGRYFNRCGGKNLDDAVLEELANHTLTVRGAITGGARILRRYIMFELPCTLSISELEDILHYARDQVLRMFMAIKPMKIPDSIKQAAVDSESQFYSHMKRFGHSRINFSDLDFMVRKCAHCGPLPAALPDRDMGLMTPASVAAFTDGNSISESVNYIKISDGAGKNHYRSYIHFVDIPYELPLSGIDLFNTSEFTFSFDASIHFRCIPSHQAQKQTDSQKRLLTAQMDEAINAWEAPGVNEQEGISGSQNLEENLSQGKPLAQVSVCLGITHADKKELHAQASQLQAYFLRDNFRAVKPASKQLESLMSFIPGSKPAAPLIECDPGYIAAMGPHFDSGLGDPTGFMLGWSGQSPVWWMPGRSARELNKTNAIIIVGNLGGGKSVLAKVLAYFVLLTGGYVLVNDPKNEYRVFLKHLQLSHLIQVADLSPRGGAELNPFILSRDESRAKSIAMDYINLALDAGNREARKLCISQCMEKVFRRPRNDRNMDVFRHELRMLESDNPQQSLKDEARNALYLLQLLEQSDVGRMVFGHNTVGFFENGQRMGVMNISEIPRPKAGIPFERWTEGEKQGVAMSYLMAAITRETAFNLPRDIPKLMIYDEAHVLTSISQGEAVLDESIRMGRTYGLIPVLISQNISDLDRPVFINNVGQIFCFRTESTEEARHNLRVLKAGEEVVKPETFSQLMSGQCLFKDAENRIGWLDVDVQPPYLMELFNTTPDSKFAVLGI
jgi:energy-coupling factor transporter ATP-binding protein EcfA2